MGAVLSWIAQLCLVADGRAVGDPMLAETVAALYGQRLLHEAYQVSKHSDSDALGRMNVASVLATVDWAGVRRVFGRDPISSGLHSSAWGAIR